jgi:uncharacterized integral membrane protein
LLYPELYDSRLEVPAFRIIGKTFEFGFNVMGKLVLTFVDVSGWGVVERIPSPIDSLSDIFFDRQVCFYKIEQLFLTFSCLYNELLQRINNFSRLFQAAKLRHRI